MPVSLPPGYPGFRPIERYPDGGDATHYPCPCGCNNWYPRTPTEGAPK